MPGQLPGCPLWFGCNRRTRQLRRGSLSGVAEGCLVFAESAVDVEFFCCEPGEHIVVAAAVGFGEQGADLALAALHPAVFEGVEGICDLFGYRCGLGAVIVV